MKKIVFALISLALLASCNQQPAIENPQIQFIDSTDMTNNFYDNTETFDLPVAGLTVEGEVANPGKVDFAGLPVRSVIVKETLLDSAGGDRFTGAYRYDGYSLFDILEKTIIRKANAEEFNSIIDLFIEIENDKGDKVVFSWGEIFYPNVLHKILIAKSVSRIVPSKTKELWVLPVNSKIVVSGDLITERNISDPSKITVRSFPKSFNTIKGLSPMYAGKISVYEKNNEVGVLESLPAEINEITYNTIFYGRGKGIHSTTPFTGVMLKDVIGKFYTVSRENLRSGIICIAGKDGYRSALSYSEIFNRNDQQEILLIKTPENEDGGLFRMFTAGDFFSDRAIKSVSSICLGY